jgi:hypothetical protein
VERDRAAQETARAAAEQARAAEEQARAPSEGERENAESVRTAAETARATADNARAQAEIARMDAEQARAAAFSTGQSELDGKAVLDDAAGPDAWSSQHIVDALCPPFARTGGAVRCAPVAGYPLGITWRSSPRRARSPRKAFR